MEDRCQVDAGALGPPGAAEPMFHHQQHAGPMPSGSGPGAQQQHHPVAPPPPGFFAHHGSSSSHAGTAGPNFSHQSMTTLQHAPSPMLVTHQHKKAVMGAVIDKTLVNLNVLAKIEEGDKLDWTHDGKFVIQKPTWVTAGVRFLKRTNRWVTLEHINDVINNAELIEEHGGRAHQRVSRATAQSVHGLRNLQATYKDNPTVAESIQVLIDRIQERYNLPDSDVI